MIAQITGAPEGLAVWLGCLAFIVMLANQGLRLKDRVFGRKPDEIYPQPLEVREAHAVVRERDCMARHESVTDAISEMRAQRIQDAKDAGAGREKMYNAVKDVRMELSEHVEDVRRELAEKIDNMPAQIVAQLLNSKQIFNR
jgi:hypothetical protein